MVVECECCETTITSDGTVSWITHSVSSGVITRVNHSGPCVTYYVDSASGGGAEAGSGTELDPWTNLNTVFLDSCIFAICSSCSNCPKVKVLVKGTIDYTVVGGGNYSLNLIIEPWGIGTIPITVSGASVKAVSLCVGCILKNFVCTTSGSNAKGFSACGGCAFDTCIANASSSSSAGGFGFHNCGGAFDTCNGAGVGLFSSLVNGTGFHGCGGTFNDCIGTGTGTGGGVPDSGHTNYGFNDCGGDFDGCTGTGTGLFFGYGFFECGNSFNNCSGNGIGTGTGTGTAGQGHGFNGCTGSIFDTCTGTGTGGGTGNGGGTLLRGLGFTACDSSTFDTCSGVGIANGTLCRQACGFYINVSPSFINCSTSDRICTADCDSIPVDLCSGFACDI